jgi:cytidine deaminase
LGIQDVADDSRVLVVDGIRNTGEIDRLRELFGFRFTLIALTASQEARWDRIGSSAYLGVGRTREDYVADDARDRNEETSWGQAVELCVDASDIILANSADVTLGSFKAKVFEYFDLITGKATRHARPDEIHMNLAYSSSHGSKCIKRQVGAVVVNPDGGVVGIGYNENPDTTFPCVEEPKYGFSCYRDIVRNDHFRQLDTKGTLCPTCGTAFGLIVGPPWVCPTCKASGMKTSLESIFFPDRAMTWCTAIHAEVRAILAAGEKAKGATLFSTTFPCTQCSEFIAQAGILRVVFTESYPDIRSADRLDLAGIAYAQFEGVRSASFERIFRSGRSR